MNRKRSTTIPTTLQLGEEPVATARRAYRPVVVAPTYNNANTLLDVIARIEQTGLDLIVVNDGSTDATGQLLGQWESDSGQVKRAVATHPHNRGKAAALWTGFELAQQRGYTHAVTIDTDGQLDPAQIPLLIARSQHNPLAMILGQRDENAPDYPRASRWGRLVSNTLLSWHSGARVGDSQCGFRVYPLSSILELNCRFGRYGFETEVLTRAAWAGIPIRQIHVSCAYEIPSGRVSHFRPWRDSFQAVGMHALLLSRALLPWPVKRVGKARTGIIPRRLVQWLNPRQAWIAAKGNPREQNRLAIGLGIGAFIGNLPIFGFHSPVALLVARRMRLHPLAVLCGAHISIPPLAPMLIASAIFVGHCLVHGHAPQLSNFDPRAVGYAALLKNLLLEWTLGALICGAMLGLGFYLVSRVVIGLLRSSDDTPATPEPHPPQPAQALDHAIAK